MLAPPAPPILLEDLIDDLDAVVDLFERSAPHRLTRTTPSFEA